MPPLLRTLAATAIAACALAAPAAAGTAPPPRYDVPPGFHRCAGAQAWNGFFKWASAHHATCARAAAFLRAYGRTARAGHMPTRVGPFRCEIRYWRDRDGNVYASRHTCRDGQVVIRFYGMV